MQGIKKIMERDINTLGQVFEERKPPNDEEGKKLPQGWKYRSIELSYPNGGRPLEVYLATFGIGLEELRNKRILNIGAGSDVKVAVEIDKLGLNSQVTELSPDFYFSEFRNSAQQAAKELKDRKLQALSAVLQNLPFKSQSFDIILMLHVAQHLETRDECLNGIREIARVLAPGGKAFIGPTIPRYLHEEHRVYDPFWETISSDPETAEYLRENGVTITYEGLEELEELVDKLPGYGYKFPVYHPSYDDLHYGDYLGHRVILEKSPHPST